MNGSVTKPKAKSKPVEVVPEVVDEEKPKLDLSNLISLKFQPVDDHLAFKCCTNTVYNPTNWISKIKDFSCQFCTHKSSCKKTYPLIVNNQVMFYVLMNDKIRKLQDSLVELRQNLFRSTTTFYFIYLDEDVDVFKVLEDLDKKYDDKIADRLENAFDSFKKLSVFDYLNVVVDDFVVEELDECIKDDLISIKQTESRIKKLQYFKKHFKFDKKTDVNTICNKLFSDIEKFDMNKYIKESL
jgi:hypothetical protein